MIEIHVSMWQLLGVALALGAALGVIARGARLKRGLDTCRRRSPDRASGLQARRRERPHRAG